MSLYIRCTAVIGARIYDSKLIRKVKVRAFEHDYPEDYNLCPKTGRALWKEQWFSTITQQEIFEPPDRVGKYKVYRDSRDEFCVVAVQTADGVNPMYDKPVAFTGLNSTALGLLEAQKVELQEFLAAHGLWIEDSFGLYSVCYIS